MLGRGEREEDDGEGKKASVERTGVVAKAKEEEGGREGRGECVFFIIIIIIIIIFLFHYFYFCYSIFKIITSAPLLIINQFY